ncbi:MAG: DUF58 domain-containing protein [Gloeocapsa sp. DLM2.Bin57]|nr:MAG: DUF58 domain-containing protein [Gloeocapsa sp. DLM2.Bin57]
MLIPAQRLYLLLGVISIISLGLRGLIGPQTSLGVMLGLDAIILLIAIVDGWRTKKSDLNVIRNTPEHLSIGRDNPITLTVESKSPRKEQIQISDGYPREFQVNITEFQLELEPSQSQELIYTIHPLRRGEFYLENIQIRQLSPWGLMWRDFPILAKRPLLVYPDLIGLRELTIKLTRQNSGTMRQAKRLGRGTDFAELREYSQGDDSRLIDHKATARRSVPIVKILEPEQEQTLIILLDRGRLMTAQIEGMTRFDWGLNATLSLALAGLHRGDRVGVGVFDRQVVTWIPPSRNQQQLSILIESLSRIQPVLLESDYTGTISQLLKQQTRRALVVILTDWIDVTASGELLHTMISLSSRYLPFCVAIKDPIIDIIAQKSTENLTEAYTQAVALNLLKERQLAINILKQKGVFVLDACANQIKTELVDRYLQLKDANRI